MATPRVTTIDFETLKIQRRPQYPPVPVGVSIEPPGQRARYYGWGHPTKNNCNKGDAVRALRAAWNSGPLLFHNAKFDYDVATTHLGMKELPWSMIHDTLYLLFLNNPHSRNLSLKPSAAELLNLPPEEQDRVKDWVLAHKGEIERRHGKFTPKEWGAYISEAPGDLVGPYANGDVTRTRKLFRLLYPKIVAAGMLPAYERERELMPILLENEREGIETDYERLSLDITIYTDAKAAAEHWLRKRLKTPDLNLDSDAEVANALDRAKQIKSWVLTKTGKRSTSKKNMTPDMFKDRKIASVLGYRNRLATCLGTFMEPWALMAASDGRIRTNWNQVRNDAGYGARTGRMSSNPNLQNIPTVWDDKGDGYVAPTEFDMDLPPLPLIREYVVPDARGQVWGRRDYNQQELRLLAHYEDGKLMQAYTDDPTLDMHNFVRDEVHRISGREYERRPIKIINFGMIYGQGVPSLAEMIGCPVVEAKALKQAHRRALPDVKALEDGIKEAARSGEPIRTLGGRLYYVEEPMMINGHMVTWEYKLLNYLIQGSAADCTKQAVINYHKTKEQGRFTVTVHDEINITVPRKAAKHEMQVLEAAMADIKLDVPLLSDGKTGKNWAVCK